MTSLCCLVGCWSSPALLFTWLDRRVPANTCPGDKAGKPLALQTDWPSVVLFRAIVSWPLNLPSISWINSVSRCPGRRLSGDKSSSGHQRQHQPIGPWRTELSVSRHYTLSPATPAGQLCSFVPETINGTTCFFHPKVALCNRLSEKRMIFSEIPIQIFPWLCWDESEGNKHEAVMMGFL